MMGNVFQFENGLTLEVIVDVFGTNRKSSDWGAKGLRAHIKNADTCEQYDFDYWQNFDEMCVIMQAEND